MKVDLRPGERGMFEIDGEKIELVAVSQPGCKGCFFDPMKNNCSENTCAIHQVIYMTLPEAIVRKLTK